MRALVADPRLRAAALALAAVAAFAPALGGGLVFDDHVLLGPGSVVEGPLSRIWLGTEAWDYWPLTWTSLWLDRRLLGGSPLAHHAVNVALHAAAAVLLWRVLLRLRIPGAFLAALLFAVHPATVESVAWISERKNVLSAVPFFGAALLWLRWEETGRRRAWAAALLLFAAALLAKTSTVMLPVALAGAALARGRPIRPLARWLDLAPFFALSLALGLVTLWFQRNNAMPEALLPARSPLERIFGAAWALWRYLETALVPARLAVVYPDAPLAGAAAALPLGGLVLAATLLGALAVRGSRAARAVLLALGYHAAVLLPVLGLVDIAYFSIAPISNHLQYLALPGPLALAASALARLGSARARWAAPAAAAALVAALGAFTAARASAFEDDLALWRRAAREAPDALFAQWMYADALGERGERAAALRVLSDAGAGARDPAVRLRARSLSLAHSGAFAPAVSAALEAEQIRPDPEFLQELGVLLVRARHPAEAIYVLRPVARDFPRAQGPGWWLSMALLGAGAPGEAEATLRALHEVRPSDPLVREGLALVLATLGRGEEARGVIAAVLPPGAPAGAVEARLRAVLEAGPDRALGGGSRSR